MTASEFIRKWAPPVAGNAGAPDESLRNQFIDDLFALIAKLGRRF